MRFANRMNRLGTETAFEVLAKAKALEAKGKNVIHLEIGEPDFDTPANIVEAGVRALQSGRTHYTPAAGIPELRSAIAKDVMTRRGVEISPDEIAVTPGAKPIMYYVITALVGPGDEVIYPNPGFPIYESVIEFVGGKAVPLPLKEERGFSFDIADLEASVTDKTRLIIINTPANPTGGILSRADVQAIAKIARERNIPVLSDEVYKNIIYDGEHVSIMAEPGMRDLTILLDGFSKTYSMTGWRLGFGVMQKDLAAAVAKLMVNSNSCTATFTQDAGVEALLGPQDEPAKMVEEFRKRRDFVVKGLNELPGVSCIVPKGAFYVFPNVSEVPMESKKLADYILNEANVAVLSGTAFGEYGKGYLRLSYANSIANIEEGLNRIYKALKQI